MASSNSSSRNSNSSSGPVDGVAKQTFGAIRYSSAPISTTGTGSTRLGITIPASSSSSSSSGSSSTKKRPLSDCKSSSSTTLSSSSSASCHTLANIDDLNDPAVFDEVFRNIHPREYAESMFRQNGCDDFEAVRAACKARVKTPTTEMLDAYAGDIVTAVRNNDVQRAKHLYETGMFKGGINACNRFGESVLHIACRRGHFDMVRFLILQAGLSITEIRDDYHRTPLHDAFWTTTASFEVVDLLLRQPFVAELLLCKDKRGFTPLDYTRAEDRGRWLRFLWERKSLLRPTSLSSSSSSSSSSPSLTSVAMNNTRTNGTNCNNHCDDLPSLANESSSLPSSSRRKKQRGTQL